MEGTKRRMTLRSGRAVLGDISNKGGNKPGVFKKQATSKGAQSRGPSRGAKDVITIHDDSNEDYDLEPEDDDHEEEQQDEEQEAEQEEEEENFECEEEGAVYSDSDKEEGDEEGSASETANDEEEDEPHSSDEEDFLATSSKGKRKASQASRSGVKKSKYGRRSTASDIEREMVTVLPTVHPVHAADKKDKDDPLHVVDYVEDIYQYLRAAELERAAEPYMDRQREVNARMRAILIDWVVEVHQKFKLVAPTLYLAVQIIDRYCMDNLVNRSKLQLIGTAAVLIACKYEEIYPPEIRDCVYITDNAYTRDEILRMEQKILHFFRFNVSMPTIHQFLVRFLKIANGSHLCSPRAQYFAERALQEHDMLKWKPSLVAAAAVYLAKRNETLDAWTPVLIEYSGYVEDDLLPCATLMSKWAQETTITASKRLLNAVKKKFASSKYMEISELDHLRLQPL